MLRRHLILRGVLACFVLPLAGCSLICPEVSYHPVVHNPFPQLSRVAIAPFFNQSDEPTVDGRQFAMAYFAELQQVAGYEVVPLGVVEETIVRHQVDFRGAGEARRLAQLLGVDAVVIGSVTDYSPYYPPRCGMRVEWYAANPGFHEIPAGYGLPWGTPQEEYIPPSLVMEAEMALARAQLATQSPDCSSCERPPGEFPFGPAAPGSKELLPDQVPAPSAPEPLPVPGAGNEKQGTLAVSTANHHVTTALLSEPHASPVTATDGATHAITTTAPPAEFPPDWPDARGFVPPGPLAARPPCEINYGPVMTHTRIFHGHDPDFTAALASYVEYRDDARFGGWQSYLERSDDFIRFCCHMHLVEMLSARGGGGETRVVSRWSESR